MTHYLQSHGEPFVLVQNFAPMQQRIYICCHKIIFLFKKLHHILRENCVRSPYLDIRS
jgi:hypothetical protein